jgi:hypothetical protein
MIYGSIGVWLATVAATLGSAAFVGVPVTPATGAVALAVGIVPVALMLRLRAVERITTIASTSNP